MHLDPVVVGERERLVRVHVVYCTVSTDPVPMWRRAMPAEDRDT